MVLDAVLITLLWVSITIGFTTAWILDSPKNWIMEKIAPPYDEYVAKLMGCPQCSGFWIGILGAFIKWPYWIGVEPSWIVPVAQGFIVSFLSYLAGIYLRLSEE